MTTDHLNIDRRQFGRRTTHTLGRIKLPGRPALSCLLKNISDGGALLVFDKPVWLPFAFLLMTEGDSRTFGCEVRHHYGVRVGVEFVDEALIPADSQQSWIAPGGTCSILRS